MKDLIRRQSRPTGSCGSKGELGQQWLSTGANALAEKMGRQEQPSTQEMKDAGSPRQLRRDLSDLSGPGKTTVNKTDTKSLSQGHWHGGVEERQANNFTSNFQSAQEGLWFISTRCYVPRLGCWEKSGQLRPGDEEFPNKGEKESLFQKEESSWKSWSQWDFWENETSLLQLKLEKKDEIKQGKQYVVSSKSYK